MHRTLLDLSRFRILFVDYILLYRVQINVSIIDSTMKKARFYERERKIMRTIERYFVLATPIAS